MTNSPGGRINSGERLSSFREQEEQRKQELSRNPGSLFVIHPYGIGRKRFGKANRIYNPETGMERFKTTVFVVLFWLPLIPNGTFLVERERGVLAEPDDSFGRARSRTGSRC